LFQWFVVLSWGLTLLAAVESTLAFLFVLQGRRLVASSLNAGLFLAAKHMVKAASASFHFHFCLCHFAFLFFSFHLYFHSSFDFLIFSPPPSFFLEALMPPPMARGRSRGILNSTGSNNCFLSCVVQVLFDNEPFRDGILLQPQHGRLTLSLSPPHFQSQFQS